MLLLMIRMWTIRIKDTYYSRQITKRRNRRRINIAGKRLTEGKREEERQSMQKPVIAVSFAEFKESAFDKMEKRRDRLEEAFSLCLLVRWPRQTLIMPEVPVWVHGRRISQPGGCRKMLNDAENTGSILATSKTVTRRGSKSWWGKYTETSSPRRRLLRSPTCPASTFLTWADEPSINISHWYANLNESTFSREPSNDP